MLSFCKCKMSLKVVKRELIDIGANLTDTMFQGIYNNVSKHQADLEIVLKRAKDAGVGKIIATAGNLEDSENSIKMAISYPNFIYNTVGCHPTRCSEISDGDEYFSKLGQLVTNSPSTTVAVGECGLDYDRLQFCDKDTQKKYFEKHFEITESSGLPLFLHCRNAAKDLTEILRRNLTRWQRGGGVVHSFDSSLEDAVTFMDLGLYIGINGCSLKSQINIDVLRNIPQDRLMIETDCPWCEIRPTHAAFKYVASSFVSTKKEKWSSSCRVKGRNEPANLIQILEVMAKVREEDIEQLATAVYQNTMRVFFPQQS